MGNISAREAAKLLGITLDELKTLEKQGVLRAVEHTGEESFYSSRKIAGIKSRHGLSLSEEAAQVGIQIQQETVSSISLFRKVLIAAGGIVGVYLAMVVVVAILFILYPLQASDFFGYYYRSNTVKQLNSSTVKRGNVLAAETGPAVAPGGSSVLAYVLKPVTAVALVPIKVVDNQKFLQVVTPPNIGAAGLNGSAGAPGATGANGVNGVDGATGLTGAQGLAGTAGLSGANGEKGADGSNGINGSNGLNGTNADDVLTAAGGIIIRNGLNATIQLPAGSNGQVLTVSGGIPAWENSGGTGVTLLNALAGSLTIAGGGINTISTLGSTITVTGTLPAVGTAGTYGTALNIPVLTTDAQGRITGVTNTSISGLTTANFGSANISQWTNNSGYITPSSIDSLTNKSLSGLTNTFNNIPNSALTNSSVTISAGTGLDNGGTVSLGGTVMLSMPSIGTAGTYGNAATIPVITTDIQGRVSGITATGISGLTASNLSAGDFSSKINSGTYSINISGNAATATSATSATSAISATNFSGLLAGDVTGTQGATTVAKINGAVLGTTTATSGNLLIGSGTQWVSQAISNDATINSSGVLTLKSVGTPGSYGSATAIPVITTDIQGRVTGATNTTISGLTNTNLSGTAGITNANLANSAISVSTGTAGSDFNISGSPVSLGGTLTLNIPNASASNRGLLTSTEWSTFNGKQNSLGYTPLNSASNLSDLTSASAARTNLGLGTLAIQSGTFSGTSSGTNTGDQTISLTGDVTGSGIGSFATTLKNTGTAGIYGTATNIPVFITDAQGRVTSVTNTSISGLTVSNFSSANISQWTNNSGYLTSEADTLASVTGRGATTSTALTLSNIANAITAGTLTATGGTINGTTIGSTTPSTGVFTTINGLTITNNGSNTLNVAAGKTLIVNNSITFGGIDGTTFALPSSSDTLVGRSSTDTLTNKTIAAGSNTISGLTVSNFGSANISQWTNNSGYLTSEADTLASVTGRGASTSTGLTLNGGVTTTTSTALTLDSGTTGGVSVGTGANAKTITIGNSTGATAVNINSGTGNVNFTVDGTGTSGKVQIGNSGTATPDLLVLDNGTADPTGVNGGMYYNTGTGKFRCYENSAWANCISTGGGSGTGFTTVIEKNSDETLASSTSMQPDDELKFSAAANTAYILEFFFRYSNTNATPDFKYELVGPAGSTGRLNSFGFSDHETAATNGVADCNIEDIDAAPTVCTISTTVISYDWGVHIIGQVQTGVTAGDITLNWAQRVSNAATTTVKKNGILRYNTLTGGADLAEMYSTNDLSIKAGDVVSLDPGLPAGMKKSQKAYDQSVLGIISTKPGLVIGNVDKEGVKALPVALSGRVPVKVSSENGKINAGDYLTTSSTPGVAMKSTEAGAIIGTAMTSFDGEGIGQALVFVKNGSSTGSSDVLIQLLSDPDKQLMENSASSSAEPAKAKSVIETNLIGYITQIVSDFFKKTVEFFGTVIFHTDVTFLGRPTFNKDTAGHVLIKTGDNEVSVIFEKEYAQNPVVTANVNLVGGVKADEIPIYAVYDMSTKGFKIKLSRAATFDLNFSWIALAVTGDDTSTNRVSDTPLLSPIPTVIPLVTPSPSPEIVPSQTATESASPSAEPLP